METLDPVVRVVLEAGLAIDLPSRASLSPLHRATIANLVPELPKYVEYINSVDSYGRTALFYATAVMSIQCVETLLQMGADPNIREYASKTGPLHLASCNGHAQVLDVLLSSSTVPVQVNLKNRTGDTPLLCACKGLNWSCVRLLLDATESNSQKICQADAKDSKGWTVLHHMAAKATSPTLLGTTMKQLRAHKFDLETKDNDGNTALHVAASYCNLVSLEMLCANSGYSCNPSAENNNGYTALHVAALTGFVGAPAVKVVNALLGAGVPIAATDNEGKTCMDTLEHIATAKRWSDAEVMPLRVAMRKLQMAWNAEQAAHSLAEEEEADSQRTTK